MPARLLKEWQAYSQVEPFGPPAAFWRTGLVASQQANLNRTKKTQKAYHPEDFMPSTMTAQDEPAQDLGERLIEACQTLAVTDAARRERR